LSEISPVAECYGIAVRKLRILVGYPVFQLTNSENVLKLLFGKKTYLANICTLMNTFWLLFITGCLFGCLSVGLRWCRL